MSPHPKGSAPLRWLLLALMVVPPVAVLLGLPWLKQQPAGTMFLLTGIASVVTVAASMFLAVMHDRRLDEFERGNARFASQWGWIAGVSIVAVLMAFTPVRDQIVVLVANVAGVPDPNQKVVLLSFALGFGAVSIACTLCTILFAIGWASWKLRAPRDAS